MVVVARRQLYCVFISTRQLLMRVPNTSWIICVGSQYKTKILYSLSKARGCDWIVKRGLITKWYKKIPSAELGNRCVIKIEHRYQHKSFHNASLRLQQQQQQQRKWMSRSRQTIRTSSTLKMSSFIRIHVSGWSRTGPTCSTTVESTWRWSSEDSILCKIGQGKWTNNH